MKQAVWLVFLSFILMSCSTLSEQSDIDILASQIVGTFETEQDNTENIIRDQRVRILSPQMDGIWYYAQLNTGENGKLYRQRVANLTQSEDGRIIQKTYALKSPEKYENAWDKPDLLQALSVDDLDRLFDAGCELVWSNKGENSWAGYVNPKTCIVASKRRNMDIHIESELRLTLNQYQTNERGFDADGKQLWGTPPGEYILLNRTD